MAKPQATLVPHGTLDYAELRALGLRAEELTVFSSNINPYGPPPAVVAALRAALTGELIARYPDRLSLDLRDALASHIGLSADAILVGNGTSDLMWLIGLSYLQGRRVAILSPTFGEYANVARIMHAEVIEVAHPGWEATSTGYAPAATTLEDVAAALARARPDAVFLCNPNNPSGHYLPPEGCETLYAAAPHALWIVDEAYAEFMQPAATTAAWIDRGNWLVLRSMTKDFALGGLRVGYALADPELIAPLQVAQPPWNVNILAQVAGTTSLREGIAWRTETLAKLHTATRALQDQLRESGWQPHPTTVNYFLLPVEDARALRRALLAERLVVRDCTSFGLPRMIRIATQLPDANARLVAALRQLVPLNPGS